jgi:hypothetical protein
MKANISERTFEQFSAYLDGQLSPAEAKNLEEQIRLNPDWRLAIEELDSTRKLLRSAPRYRAPRNFTITTETARGLGRKSLFPPFPAFRFSAVLATLAILGVAALQVIGMGTPAVRMVALAPQAAPVMENAPMDSAEAQKSQAAQPAQIAQPTQTLQQGNASGIGEGVSGESTAPPTVLEAGKAASVPAPGGGIVTYGDQTASPRAGGMGGGGPGSPPITLPLEAVSGAQPQSPSQSQPQAEATQSPSEVEQPAPERSAAAGIEGSGPILGVAPSEEQGQIIATYGSPAAEKILPDNSANQVEPAGLAPLRFAQIGLGVLALLFVAAALIFRARRL